MPERPVPRPVRDVELSEKAGEIMTKLLGRDFFDEMQAGGLAYGKLTIGG